MRARGRRADRAGATTATRRHRAYVPRLLESFTHEDRRRARRTRQRHRAAARLRQPRRGRARPTRTASTRATRPGCGGGCWSRSAGRTGPGVVHGAVAARARADPPGRARPGPRRLVLLGAARRDRSRRWSRGTAPATRPRCRHGGRPPPATDIYLATGADAAADRATGAATRCGASPRGCTLRRARACARRTPGSCSPSSTSCSTTCTARAGSAPSRCRPDHSRRRTSWEAEAGPPTSTTPPRGYRAATGTSAFAYSDSGARTVAPGARPDGVGVRESRDSDEHPHSHADRRAVRRDRLDGRACRGCCRPSCRELLGLLLRKGYATDPQIMFGAIGDATCDRVPLQVGQFESDNRMDEDLGPDRARGRRRRPEDRVVRAGHVLHGPAHRARLLREARPPRLPVHHRRRDGLPAGQAASEVRDVIGDELGEPITHRGDRSPSCSRSFDVYYILPDRGRLRRRHARSSATGASCSARTSSSSTTSTRSARRSR